MRISVQELGPLARLELPLSPLTVVQGPNNAGKSWLCNAIYSAGRRLSIEGRLDGFAFPAPAELKAPPALGAAIQAAKAALDAKEGAEHRLGFGREVLSTGAPEGGHTAPAGTLARWLGVPDQLPPRAVLRWQVDAADPPLFERATATMRRQGGKLLLTGALEGEAFDPLPIEATYARHEAANAVLQLAGWLRDALFRRAVAFPEERLGLAELSAQRGREGGTERPFLSEAARDLGRVLGALRGYAPETRAALGGDPELLGRLSDEVLGGRVEMDTAGELTFRFGVTRLPLQAAGAGVRALALLSLYLEFLASPGDLLVLDAPELGLGPAARLALAGLLVELAERGWTVVVATREAELAARLARSGARVSSLEPRPGGSAA